MSDGAGISSSKKRRKKTKPAVQEEEEEDHQAELDALREKDPEFYKFLKENDEKLLTFDKEDDDDEAPAAEEEQEEEEEEEDRREVLTASKFEAMKKSLSKKKSTGRQAAGLVRLACQVDDDGEKTTIADPDVRADALAFGCDLLSATTTYSIEAKVAVKALVSALSSKTSGTALPLLAARGLRRLTPCFRDKDMVQKIGSRLARALVEAWAAASVLDLDEEENEDEDASEENVRKLQVEAFLRLRELLMHAARGKDDAYVEMLLRKAYSAFAAKTAVQSATNANKNRRRAPAVSFVAAGVADLYVSSAISYRLAFGYVRQLALKVRNAIADPKKNDSEILAWRFVHALRVWCAVATSTSNQNQNHDNHQEKDAPLSPLVFPLCQTLFGAIHVAKRQPKFAPFQLHCVRALHALAAKRSLYVPTAHALTTLVDAFLKSGNGGGPDSSKKKKKNKGKGAVTTSVEAAANLDFVVALSDKDVENDVVREEVVKEACDLLGDWIDLVKYAPALPELCVVPVLDLKQALKKKTTRSSSRAVVSATINAFQTAAHHAETQRATLLAGKTPKDLLDDLEPLKPKAVPDCAERHALRRKERKARKAKLLGLTTKNLTTHPPPAAKTAEEQPTTTTSKRKKRPREPPPTDEEAADEGEDDVITNLNIDDF